MNKGRVSAVPACRCRQTGPRLQRPSMFVHWAPAVYARRDAPGLCNEPTESGWTRSPTRANIVLGHFAIPMPLQQLL